MILVVRYQQLQSVYLRQVACLIGNQRLDLPIDDAELGTQSLYFPFVVVVRIDSLLHLQRHFETGILTLHEAQVVGCGLFFEA